MKTTRYFGFLILLLSGLFFIQCTSDPIVGPPGMDGRDGIDGINGQDGVDGQDGTASCIACHNDANRMTVEDSYMYSHHYNQHVMYDGSNLTDYTNQSFFNGSCQRCHSNEGYIDYITGRPAATIDRPSVVSCTTCHDSHSTFDFENDGQDYALRMIDPVTLISDASIHLDFGDTSNSCIDCHQPRSAPPVDDGSGMYEITSKRFGPHHSPQATFLAGIGGAVILGSEAIPAINDAAHANGSSCVQCHMADTDNDRMNGLHSWETRKTMMDPNGDWNVNACNTCHTNGAPMTVGGLEADMATLQGLLDANGMFDADGYANEGTYTITLAKAYWNWKMVKEDQSHGIHNPGYAKALIKNSIEALQQ